MAGALSGVHAIEGIGNTGGEIKTTAGPGGWQFSHR